MYDRFSVQSAQPVIKECESIIFALIEVNYLYLQKGTGLCGPLQRVYASSCRL